MVHLSHFHSKQKILIVNMSILFLSESAMADLLSLFNPFDIPKNTNTLYVNTQTLLINDAFSLEGLFNHFDGEFLHKNTNNLAIGDIRYDAGIHIEPYGYIGYTYRKEALMEISPDTALLVNQVNKKLDLSLGKKYQLYLALKGFETHGITLSKTVPLYQGSGFTINFGLAMELLYGIQTQKGKIEGEASTLSSHDYNFNVHSNYLYTENYLYDLDVNKVTSYGYTTHLSLHARYKQISLDLIVNDIIGKLYWDNLPYSIVNLTSSNKSYDENGYVEYSPFISGMENYQKHTQTLMQKWRLEAGYTFTKGKLELGAEHIYSTYLPYIKYTHFHENNIISSLSYESYFGMFGIDIKYDNYYFGVYSNGVTEPSAAKVNLGLFYTF